MFRARTLVLCLLASLVLFPVTAHAENTINFLGGFKALDSTDWPEDDAQAFGGITTTFGPERWPVQIAIDLLGGTSSNDQIDLELSSGVNVSSPRLIQSTWELDFGVRKIWRKGKVRPFVGGGFALICASQERFLDDNELPDLPGGVLGENLVLRESGGAGGVWINGGVFWRLSKRFNIGVDAFGEEFSVFIAE